VVVDVGAAAPGNNMAAAASECRRTGRLVVGSASASSHQSSTVVTGTGYLSSEATVASGGIGTSDCLFTIRAASGQRIRLSLVAFVGGSRLSIAETQDEDSSTQTPRPGLCYEVGTVTELVPPVRPAQKSEPVVKPLQACGLPAQRSSSSPSVLYQSETSNITVQLHPIPVLRRLAPFIIKYEGTSMQNCKLKLETVLYIFKLYP